MIWLKCFSGKEVTMEYKKGFNKKKFEDDHFVFRRGSGEKHFCNWDELRYEGGLAPMHVNKQDLEDGNMSKPLYDFLTHVFGYDGMAKYFPHEAEAKKRKPILHFGVGSAMAAHVDGKKPDTMPSGVMTDDEVDALAEMM